MQSSYTKHNINDYIGKKFGNLTVIGQSPKTNEYSNKFDFRCDCDNIISEVPSRILYGHKKSCGICRKRNSSYELEQKIKNSIGQKFGKLTIVDISHKPNDGKTYVKCCCDCGNFVDVLPNQLFREQIKSCGCSKNNNEILKNSKSTSSGNYKDGRTKHPLYGVWKQMLDRCENPSAKHYDRYGGRGIKVCDEWHDFWKFVEWSDSVGGRPKGYTLDRKDNDGNYCSENCRWASWETQTRNKSSNIVIEYNGVSKTLVEWSDEIGINHQTLLNRLNRGWSVDRAFTEKPNRNSHNLSRSKIIYCYDLIGNLVSQYKNLSQLPQEFDKRCVSRCCCGGRKTYKGYIWKYEDE